MPILVVIAIVVAIVIAAILILTAINIVQNGNRSWNKRSIEDILGKRASEATPGDIFALSKRDVMQLFYAAEAPEFQSMKGEYKASLIPVGILAFANNFYAHHLMGPGHWEAKAFFPFEDRKGWGYNLFAVGKDGGSKIVRTMKMDTYIGKSRFDNKVSFHLVYAAYNEGRNQSMRDEIRRINDKLFVAMGCLKWSLDTLNPSPFILLGEPDSWVGPDSEKVG